MSARRLDEGGLRFASGGPPAMDHACGQGVEQQRGDCVSHLRRRGVRRNAAGGLFSVASNEGVLSPPSRAIALGNANQPCHERNSPGCCLLPVIGLGNRRPVGGVRILDRETVPSARPPHIPDAHRRSTGFIEKKIDRVARM